MILKPLGNRVVIKVVEAEEKTQSGIILAGSPKESPKVAEIIGISKDILNDDDKKDIIKIGNKVIFSEYAGTKVDIDGKELIVIDLDDVLAIVE